MINKSHFKQWLENSDRIILPEAQNNISLSDLKNAAVAIILIEKQKNIPNSEPTEYSIVFGKRSNKVSRHKGQVAFPGGAIEDDDEGNLRETAIRETEEEIGIKIDLESPEWEYLGQYPKHFISISDYLITPFIFVYKPNGGKFQYHPDGYEFLEVFDVPIKHLLDSSNVRKEKREWQGNLFDMYYYTFGDKTIWGITGWLLHDFLDSLPLNYEN